MAAAYKIIPGIVKLLNNLEQIRTYRFTCRDLASAPHRPMRPDVQAPSAIRGIEFREICFGYDNRTLLHKFTASIQPGELVWLRGPSGSGKTTLIHILLGFLEQDSGEILFNGKSMPVAERKSAWSRIAYVKQQPFLLHDTIEANILFGRPCDPARLQQVMALTGVDTFSAALDAGSKSLLAQDGKNISGGQRQRICLARALYQEADLLLLDEPFNELDGESVKQLTGHLQELATRGKMILLVTHGNSMPVNGCKIISLHEN